jgi:predicted alpha/beta superfamily hydrolase
VSGDEVHVFRLSLGCLVLVVGPLLSGCAQRLTTDRSTRSGPFNLSLTIASQALGEDRLINVHVPAGQGSVRLPVLYMPDGGLDEDFPHVVATVDSLIGVGAIRPVIVVGIPNTERRRDLTGPTRMASDSAVAPRVGGSAAFRAFIRRELIPEIERRFRTTTERAIVGESFAGLFIVETLLEDPGLFQHYIALDPSLWWNEGALVTTAATRLAALRESSVSLYLASSREPSTAAGSERLSAQLRSLGLPGVRWHYAARPDLEHATIFRALKAEALIHALH